MDIAGKFAAHAFLAYSKKTPHLPNLDEGRSKFRQNFSKALSLQGQQDFYPMPHIRRDKRSLTSTVLLLEPAQYLPSTNGPRVLTPPYACIEKP